MLNPEIKLVTLCQLLGVIVVVFGSVVQLFASSDTVTEIKTVSQCFRLQATSSPSIIMTLYCGHRRLIAVRRVVQGSRRQVVDRRSRPVDHCGFIDGDCIVDDTPTNGDQVDANGDASNFTNRWNSACDGRHYCVQTVGSPLYSENQHASDDNGAKCGQLTPIYIMVFYECLWEPVKTTSEPSLLPTNATTVVSELDDNSFTRSTNEVTAEPTVDICANYSGKSLGLTMTSPGYPGYYPENTDCRCIVRAKSQSKVSVMYKDIELTMTDQRDQCVDWLLLQSVGHRNSAAMTCGHLSGADRVISSRGNQMVLHFHSAPRSIMAVAISSNESVPDGFSTSDVEQNNQQSSAMKGFKIFIQTDPLGEFRMSCHLASADAITTSIKINSNNYGFATRDKSTAASCVDAHFIRGLSFVCFIAVFVANMHMRSFTEVIIV